MVLGGVCRVREAVRAHVSASPTVKRLPLCASRRASDSGTHRLPEGIEAPAAHIIAAVNILREQVQVRLNFIDAPDLECPEEVAPVFGIGSRNSDGSDTFTILALLLADHQEIPREPCHESQSHKARPKCPYIQIGRTDPVHKGRRNQACSSTKASPGRDQSIEHGQITICL